MLSADMQYAETIPMETTTPDDIVEQVANYFSSEQAPEVESVASEVVVDPQL
jgi:hypothetical protein